MSETLSSNATKLTYSIVSKDDALEICKLDSNKEPNVESKLQFRRKNRLQYEVAINTWLNLIMDVYGFDSAHRVYSHMKRHGLLSTISTASKCADAVIAALDHRRLPQDEDVLRFDTYFSASLSDAKRYLQILRFLKRFSPESERLRQESLGKFAVIQHDLNWRLVAKERYINNICKDPDVTPPTNRFVEPVARYMDMMLGKFPKHLASCTPEFSKGVTCDASDSTVAEKLVTLCHSRYNLESPLYPIGLGTNVRKEPVSKVLTINGVPKSHSAYRLIAPEYTANAWDLQRLRKACEASFRESRFVQDFVWTDQSFQQERAYEASLDGNLATIDMSSASDRIPRYYAKQLTPELFDAIYRYLPEKYLLPALGKRVTASTFLSSGNPLTSLYQGCFFLSCAYVARDIHHTFCKEWVQKPSVINDDIIIDTRCVDEMYSILEHFGAVVNVDKSFIDGLYRESCGVEFWAGIPLRSTYWPRKVLFSTTRVTAEDISSLVDLQHRVCEFTRTSEYLCEVVRRYLPDMTESFVGSECTDLWSYTPLPSYAVAPYGAYWKEGYTKMPLPANLMVAAEREVHYQYITNFPSPASYPDPRLILVDTYAYYRRLAEGPKYSSPLDELLGTSEPLDLRQWLYKPVGKYKKVTQ